jgi:uncharacterized protein YbbK (DUF523 family)
MSERPAHLPSDKDFARFALATPQTPLNILTSACLAGDLVGVDGSDNGGPRYLAPLFAMPNVRVTRFCPENFSYGTPRPMSDLHGGNGFDVLDGRARVVAEDGTDWTAGMTRAAERMLEIARAAKTDIAILMDISAACGSQVIYDGNRKGASPIYQKGPGLSAALLIRSGIPVISQRNFASLAHLFKALGGELPAELPRRDHHEIDWYKSYFGPKP